jgi:hypothetical protein
MLEDYFWDIEILELTKVKVGQGYISNWIPIGTWKGIINKTTPNVSTAAGKTTEVSEYQAMGALNDNIKADMRLRDKGYTYRVKGKPKDCIQLGHHISLDLDFLGYDQG